MTWSRDFTHLDNGDIIEKDRSLSKLVNSPLFHLMQFLHTIYLFLEIYGILHNSVIQPSSVSVFAAEAGMSL